MVHIRLSDIDDDPGSYRAWLKTTACLLSTPYMKGWEAQILATMIDGMNQGLKGLLDDGLVCEWEAEGIAARFRRAAESLATWPRATLSRIAHLPPEANFYNPAWFDFTDPEATRIIDLEALDQ